MGPRVVVAVVMIVRWVVLASAFLMLACGWSAPLVGATRWDDPTAPGQHPYVEGFLTAQGDNYGIAWDPSAPSEDNRPADPTPGGNEVDEAKFNLEGYANYDYGVLAQVGSGLKLTESRAPLTFVGQPYPQRTILNVTRGFQLTLYLKNTGDDSSFTRQCSYQYEYQYLLGSQQWFEPHWDIELLANGKPIGAARGDLHPHWGLVHPNRAAPANPDGYVACYYQMHAEIPILEKDTILSLKITPIRQKFDYSLGLTGDHRSSLRIWAYPLEEVLYRHPEYDVEGDLSGLESAVTVSGGGGSGPGDKESSMAFAPVLAGLAALGTASRRRRVFTVLLAVLVLSAVLSGCLKGGGGAEETDETLGGRITNTLVKSDGPLGSIAGLVHDDIHVPLSGVHVSILGAADFTQTNAKGRFTFTNMAAGTYKLRFDKTDYRSYETDIEVKAGFVSAPQVMLFLRTQKDADFRPHSHDYWGGVTKKDLLSEATKICIGTYAECWQYSQGFRLAPRGEDPRLILPGTSEVEVTLQWDTASGIDRLGLLVYTPQGNVSHFGPRAAGVPFRIQTAWEMTDVGHAKFSSWQFSPYAPGTERRSWEEERIEPYLLLDISAKVGITRSGRLPLEPAHPDHWGGKDSLDIYKAAYGYASLKGSLPPSVPGTCLYYVDCSGVSYSQFYPSHATKPIPYDAKWVEATARISIQPDPTYSIVLWYKPSDVPLEQSNVATLAGYKKAEPLPGSTHDKIRFRFPISVTDTDAEYARNTAWTFTMRFTNEDAYWQNAMLQNVKGYTQYYLDVKAHRTPFPG